MLFVISIHAPREGSDGSIRKHVTTDTDFYPRSPRGERRPGRQKNSWPRKFLSTLPARGATDVGLVLLHPAPDFYPRSPRGERRSHLCTLHKNHHFYPRSPRGERHLLLYGVKIPDLFLSTLPARGATYFPVNGSRKAKNFYPRSPRGERLNLLIQWMS